MLHGLMLQFDYVYYSFFLSFSIFSALSAIGLIVGNSCYLVNVVYYMPKHRVCKGGHIFSDM